MIVDPLDPDLLDRRPLDPRPLGLPFHVWDLVLVLAQALLWLWLTVGVPCSQRGSIQPLTSPSGGFLASCSTFFGHYPLHSATTKAYQFQHFFWLFCGNFGLDSVYLTGAEQTDHR